MNIGNDCIVSGIYNISPLHCGTGQTTGAVDLPIARDTSTGFPVLPATSLKGVARFFCDKNGMKKDIINELFGRSVEEIDNDEKTGQSIEPISLEAGALIFSEGKLLAYPVRSLNRPFFHVTCPLIMHRLERDLAALDKVKRLPGSWLEGLEKIEQGNAYVCPKKHAGHPLVLEDLIYGPGEVIEFSPLQDLAQWLCGLLPEKDKNTRNVLKTGLVLIPDEDFMDLMQRIIPVQPRIKLNENKTSENLWYMEVLPSDCLFLAFITQRPGIGKQQENNISPVEKMKNSFGYLEKVQIGGNETVGHGFSYWTLFRKSAEEQSA